MNPQMRGWQKKVKKQTYLFLNLWFDYQPYPYQNIHSRSTSNSERGSADI